MIYVLAVTEIIKIDTNFKQNKGSLISFISVNNSLIGRCPFFETRINTSCIRKLYGLQRKRIMRVVVKTDCL